MTKAEAKALGRWREQHQRRYERVYLPNGAAMSGCRECVTETEFVAALDELVRLAWEHHGKRD